MNELKAELRRIIQEEIAALPQDYITASDEGLYRNTTSRIHFIEARNIMIYCSVGREPGTLRIAETAFQMGKTVTFPHCYRGGIMHARVVGSMDELKPAMLGIPAPPETAPILPPDELELIIVPALAYDPDGYRIGYGGGYYDRFLSNTAAYTIGLCRSRLKRDVLPREPHDIPVKCVVTEDATYDIA